MRPKKRRHRKSAEMELQITALADILIILLVFLLKSYSTGLDVIENLSVNNKIKLPVVTRSRPAPQGLKVEILPDRVNLEGQPVSALEAFRFPVSDLEKEQLENSKISQTLSNALERARRGGTGPAAGNRIWVVADQRAPYATIQTVLASAAVRGYSEINLVVMKEE